MEEIPAYWLYGERTDQRFPDAMHIETIVVRSKPHQWRIKAHRHPDILQCFLILQGGGRARIDGVAHALRPGTAISIPSLIVHEFDFDDGTNGYVASIADASLARIMRPDVPTDAIRLCPAILSYAPSDPVFLALLNTMQLAHAEFLTNQAGRHAALTAHAELIALGFTRIANQTITAAFEIQNPKTKLLRRFIECVEVEFSRHKTVAEYAALLGISPTHLRRTCSEMLGCSALKIIHNRVLIEARRKLIYTGRPISLLAYELGFDDAAYFTRFFTERLGVPPSRYRAAVGDPAIDPPNKRSQKYRPANVELAMSQDLDISNISPL